MKKILIIISFGLLASCDEPNRGVEVLKTNNSEFDVHLLFEVDGCKVYRFMDYGRERYFSNCNGSVEWTESCGKNCTRDVQVPTTK